MQSGMHVRKLHKTIAISVLPVADRSTYVCMFTPSPPHFYHHLYLVNVRYTIQ